MALLLSQNVIKKLFIAALQRIRVGELTLITPEKETWHFAGKEPGPIADLTLHDWGVLKRVFVRGDVGFAEDYIDGKWDTEDLPALLTLAAMNEDALERLFHGTWWIKAWFRFKHYLRDNSKAGSIRNIRAHYDVGNDFYQLWLDASMTYSSALYEGDEKRSLEEAQHAKYKRILDKLGAKASEILEIGCGWGGFMEAAERSGHTVKGLTLSNEQAKFAKLRLKTAALGDNVAIQDYRDEKNLFDHIVSIEMFEAVGERYWDAYFAKVKELLKPGGKAVIQTITIADEIFEDYLSRSDFLQQYTFPGGALPSDKVFVARAEKAGLKSLSVYRFGQDYARTLSIWLKNLEAQILPIRELGYGEDFLRSWRFYLSYCIAGFATRRTDVMQVELEHA